MDKYQETFNTWNKVAALYEEKFMNLNLYDESYDLFCDQLNKESPRILEIGCGPGNITKYILAKRPDFDILGIDIAPNMIELAEKNNLSARFRVMDTREINQLKKPYDAIIVGFCLPYLSKKDCSKLIKNCTNLLNKEGLLYISFVEGNYNKSGFLSGSSGDKVYFYYYPFVYLKNELMANGFSILNVLKINYPKADGQKEVHTVLIIKAA